LDLSDLLVESRSVLAPTPSPSPSVPSSWSGPFRWGSSESPQSTVRYKLLADQCGDDW